MLDREAIKALVPQIGLCLKLEKRIFEYRQKCQEENETPAVALAAIDDAGEQVADVEPVLIEPQSLQPSSSQSTVATKFDVATVVMEHCEDIGVALMSGNSISYLDKLTINRAIVKHCLIAKCGVFPNSQEKVLLAKEIITTFPSLKGVDGTGYVSLIGLIMVIIFHHYFF